MKFKKKLKSIPYNVFLSIGEEQIIKKNFLIIFYTYH